MEQETQYEPSIYHVHLYVDLLVTGSNPEHARLRVDELMKSRITQYVHNEDVPPKFRVIGLIRKFHYLGLARRLVIVEGHTTRSEEYSEEESAEGSV